MENDEKKYEEVIKALKELKQVEAPENFEADLQRKINSESIIESKRNIQRSSYSSGYSGIELRRNF